jgi:hypothetical protein
MSATITLPNDLEQKIQGKAAASGQKPEEYALNLLRKAVELPTLALSALINDDESALLDVEYMAACGKEADPSISLQSVRQILAKTSGSLADDIISERDERF